MRYAQAFIPTLKEVPSDAQVASHIFLVRGGYIRKVAAGIYNFLPVGWRVIQRIEGIIREELARAGSQEILMPAATPAELWQESGRWNKYGPELLRFKDRKGADFCFGPTHEEVVTALVRGEVKSYRQLPQNLFQIQGKFRDEIRPRAGLMRGREFIMKDAYSFDVSIEKALVTYDAMYAAYQRIFRRCGLDFRPVEADTGAIGGSRSHEFQVLAESGEDAIVACDRCDYAANVEQAELRAPAAPGVTPAAGAAAAAAPVEVATPGKKSIEAVAGFLGVAPTSIVKTLVYVADGKPVAVLVRGDRGVNEVALKKLVGATDLYLARDEEVYAATKTPSGYVGPVGLDLPIYADRELEGATGAVVGGGKKDTHLTGVDLGRDARVTAYGQLRFPEAGDACARCDGGHYRAFKGIEVGHVFYLGQAYSKPLGCTFLDEAGQTQVMEMGCYGIGVTRVMAAAIEQHHDQGGIIWPMSIAPFEVEVLTLGQEPEVAAAAEAIYADLKARGVDVLFDDRDERPGAKFKDADLLGVPLRIAVGGRSLKEGVVELKWRRDKDASKVAVADAPAQAAALVVAERARLGVQP